MVTVKVAIAAAVQEAGAIAYRVGPLVDDAPTLLAALEDQLVREYGPRVLALPSHKGFNLAAYWVPILVGLLLVGTIAVLVPRWVRRGRAGGQAIAPDRSGGAVTNGGGPISPSDERRLDDELEQFGR